MTANTTIKFTFEWVPEMSVGDEHLDEQHRQLLGEVNKLLAAMINQEPPEVVGRTVNFLDDYIMTHLSDEEVYMKEHGYPEFEEHKALHQGFIDRYEIFKRELEENGPTEKLVGDLQTYIGGWWIQHIGTADKKYADYVEKMDSKLNERG